MSLHWSWLGVVALAPLLSGCMSCQELLDVRACTPETASCIPEEGVVVPWGERLAEDWPLVDALLGAVPDGKHEHAPWRGDAAAFWRDMGVDPSDGRPEVYIEEAGVVHRVRILTC